MSATFTIRPASVTDAQAVARIHVAGWRFAYRGLIPQDYLDSLDIAASTRRIHAYLQSPAASQGSEASGRSRFMLAVRGDAVLGFCGFSTYEEHRQTGHGSDTASDSDATLIGRVHSLYVSPDAVGQGIGYALMNRVLGTFTTEGCGCAKLWVLDGNSRAIRFYERQGWRLTGSTKVDRSFLGLELLEHEMSIRL